MTTGPEYLGNLQRKIYSVLASNGLVDPQDPTSNEHIQLLLSENAMTNYWIRVFTDKSIDPSNNYETYEYLGDKIGNAMFVYYIIKRYAQQGYVFTEAIGTLLTTKYMARGFQSEIVDKWDLMPYVRHDPKLDLSDDKSKSNIFEAFVGCLFDLANSVIGSMVGSVYVYRLMMAIFMDVDLNPDKIQKDAKSRLNELYTMKGWKLPKFEYSQSTDPRQPGFLVRIINQQGIVLGQGFGQKDKAEGEASEQVLDTFAKQGVTIESTREELQRYRAENDPKYNEQMARLQNAIQEYNKRAMIKKQSTIEKYQFTHPQTSKGKSGKTVYSVDIEVGQRPYKDAKIQWRLLVPRVTEERVRDAQIKLLESLATYLNNQLK